MEEAEKYSNYLFSLDMTLALFSAQYKIPDVNKELYCWGIDGVIGRKPTPTGYERVTLPTTQPELVFPAMWVKIE